MQADAAAGVAQSFTSHRGGRWLALVGGLCACGPSPVSLEPAAAATNEALVTPNGTRACDANASGGVAFNTPPNCNPAYCCDDCRDCSECLDPEYPTPYTCMTSCLGAIECRADPTSSWVDERGVLHRRIPRVDTDDRTPEEGFQNWLECEVDRIVIHRCEGNEASCIATLTESWSGRGAHFVVSEDGARITALADPSVATWHCGTHDRRCNCRSIGIEHAGTRASGPPGEAQLRASASLVAQLCVEHAIPCDDEAVIGHGQVPDDRDLWDRPLPGVQENATHATACPALWPWEHYRELVQLELARLRASAP